MAKIEVREEILAQLQDKVVIITGGAKGIGKATVMLLHEYGANVAIGDLDVENGTKVLDSIGGQGLFQKTDVTDWKSLRSLFSTTHSKYGRIDIVLANAGMPEWKPFLFDDQFDEDGELADLDCRNIDVNVNGALRTTKLAFHWFKKNPTPGGALVLTGSASSYFPTPPIVRYSAAKHALLGILRTAAAVSPPLGVRVNLVAPWMTETEFSSDVSDIWGNLPKNTSKEVAQAICLAAADESLHGRSLYVAKGIVDFELPLYQTRDRWMTAEQAERFEIGAVRLAKGMGLPDQHYFKSLQ